ncbi:carbonic anhydrase [Methylohalomonas lacus]|uniref:Carbonic anhydrase n=1 Tax=Methylohalomonas lacus TaxID=398773 RepID=A0AAE3L1H3_9GAMM|nr:carbonic anhydrase [Methylohalomonas lacus]MCS3904029.1 carbonic anhydrase [Methylohalomonas lacus]
MPELDTLIQGFRRFRQQHFIERPEIYQQLVAQGQSPKALVIACSDSRVDPALITDATPGDIFVVRNVANVVPPFVDDGKTHGTSAAIEFSVKHLQVPHIIVMGHSKCGGIRALMEGSHSNRTHGFIDPWMSAMKPARDIVKQESADADLDSQCQQCERAAVGVSLENLMGFPFVREAVEAGRLILNGWYFDFEQGELFERQVDGAYKPLSE